MTSLDPSGWWDVDADAGYVLAPSCSQVISKGWRSGRRVLGVVEDWWMIGTSHHCKLCKIDHDVLKVGSSVAMMVW